MASVPVTGTSSSLAVTVPGGDDPYMPDGEHYRLVPGPDNTPSRAYRRKGEAVKRARELSAKAGTVTVYLETWKGGARVTATVYNTYDGAQAQGVTERPTDRQRVLADIARASADVWGKPALEAPAARPSPAAPSDDAELERAAAAPPTPAPVLAVLDAVGREVGDYTRDFFLVFLADGSAYQVKLEGWGAECVEASSCSPAAMRRALAGARKLAREWRRPWPEAGVVAFDGSDDTWAVTWAVNGPLSPKGIETALSMSDDEDVIRP